MLEFLRPFYNKTLRPIARLFLKIGLHPNHITLLGVLLFIAAGVLTAIDSWHWALVLIVIGSLMDGLDGVLARESGKTTAFGAIFDSTCDRLTEMALLGGLSVYFLKFSCFRLYGPLLCYSALCSSMLVSYIKARCEGAGISCSRGILQRPERIILLCMGLLAGPLIMLWILGAVVLLGAVTIAQRLGVAASGRTGR